MISAKTAYALLGELFGKTKLVEGVNMYNEEYTVLYPHKSDACADCVRLKDQISSDKQSLKRHMQQTEKTLLRLDAIRSLKTGIQDHEEELAVDVGEAAAASNFHKTCFTGAADTYEKVSLSWEQLMGNVRQFRTRKSGSLLKRDLGCGSMCHLTTNKTR